MSNLQISNQPNLIDSIFPRQGTWIMKSQPGSKVPQSGQCRRQGSLGSGQSRLGASGRCQMSCGTPTEFRWSRIIGAPTQGKGFAFQVDQFLMQIAALGVQGQKLRLRLGHPRPVLHLSSEQVSKYPTELITLRAHGGQLRVNYHQIDLEPSNDEYRHIRWDCGFDCGFRTHSAYASMNRINSALEQWYRSV